MHFLHCPFPDKKKEFKTHITFHLSFITANTSTNHINEDGSLKMDGTKSCCHVLVIWVGLSVGVA